MITTPTLAAHTTPASPAETTRSLDMANWYQRAVFYEVLVRAFHDSDGDGMGDLSGLRRKLDYLAWLGVDCLWLPPFYASPLRDGGYDISNFRAVHPLLGTVDDYAQLLEEAHARGLRVMIDMVMNHTSDQHPWFRASRSDPEGPFGDFYVWSDTDDRFRGTRIIFIDTETSNWAYDPVRRQFYWHRFFSHQPDLNYDNPAVVEAMMDVLRFWLDLGTDGLRLDAVPYLFTREGTNGENLPETHAFLRLVRKVIDDEYPGRVLLAEANQWPREVVEYFGDPHGDGAECHMAFHFPLMPRLFLAIRCESRLPITEVLRQTPPIPESAQWGIFLRNHDELTLEMVTDAERDYLYAMYAQHPRMRANLGIRRRLAPLVGNDRRQIELLNALLLSLPGSPILYYGDEIGMGDNIWLGDRDAVRTPMQWTADRSAGFSDCPPDRLHLPLVTDTGHAHHTVNVAAQLGDPSSLLHWTRRQLLLRSHHPAFGLGSYQEMSSSSHSVFAFVRHWQGPGGEVDTVLCVNNLSKVTLSIELDLSAYAGFRVADLADGTQLPPVRDERYRMTVPGHSFYWLSLVAGTEERVVNAT